MDPEYEALLREVPRARLLERRSSLLTEFLKKHDLRDPKSVEFSPMKGAIRLRCFINVEEQVQRAGGHMETGWVFWEYESIDIHTEAHAIWITPQGRRVDITPRELPPERRILFLPEPRVAIKRGYTAGYNMVLSSDPRVCAISNFAIKLDQLFDEHLVEIGVEIAIPTEKIRSAAKRVNLPWEVAQHMTQRKMEHFSTPCT